MHDHGFMPLNEEQLAGRRHNTIMIIDIALQSGTEISPDIAGVAWLDGYINRQRESLVDNPGFRTAAGDFLGEAIVAEFGGEWCIHQGFAAVKFPDAFAVFPVHKANKHIDADDGDEMQPFMTAIPLLLDRQATAA